MVSATLLRRTGTKKITGMPEGGTHAWEEKTMNPSNLGPAVRQGLKHRLLCGGLLLAFLPVHVLNFHIEGTAIHLLPILACLLMSALGFLAPLILTEGFNSPMPSSQHLALCPVGVQRVLMLAAALLMMAPPLQRALSAA
ncbi:hypothetical protein ABDJ40_11490 [Roseateles sp. 2.12]|uniref:Uncharacterized protein n=2 Tax=Roseateles flavus TaxID=3149041 RepID=A0ABV0GEC7_9BURK